ncbi:hypothetical protein OGATHE_002622 [Ogataea polymorpha]|uniref:Uncharacterized protein n=1 Tax=Ogataea polymorpha TaxID=460523 RepID=A0A9P8PDR0_9ASCO|nr:hypothetical protein OGATHE_002622 [Ogataea polymorpha]
MYLPFELNLTSDIEEVISVKKLWLDGSIYSSNTRAWLSHSELTRISFNLMVPFEEEYMNKLQSVGWNSALVITSVSSSILTGLISTMLKDWSAIPKFHKLILRSSEEMKVS